MGILDQITECCRVKHYSPNTAKTYRRWAAANGPELRERRHPPLRCILWLATFREVLNDGGTRLFQ